MLHSYFKINDNAVTNTFELRCLSKQGLCMSKTDCDCLGTAIFVRFTFV